MTKPEQLNLFDMTPEPEPRHCCWRYFNCSKCYTKKHCDWTFKYDEQGNKYNCCEMFGCGSCDDCETPAAERWFSGECKYLDDWRKTHEKQDNRSE